MFRRHLLDRLLPQLARYHQKPRLALRLPNLLFQMPAP
jgi:hypothetical protein